MSISGVDLPPSVVLPPGFVVFGGVSVGFGVVFVSEAFLLSLETIPPSPAYTA